MKKYFFLLLIILSNLSFASDYPKECIGYENEYESELNRFYQKDLSGLTIFSGSSSIRMWKTISSDFSSLFDNLWMGTNFYNRGFGGSQICHLLIHYKEILLGTSSRTMPKRLVLYSGDNDLNAGVKAKTILAHYKVLINNLRKNKMTAPIYILTIKPSPSRLFLLDEMKRANALIETELPKLKDVYVINVFDDFFDSKGKIINEYFLEDGLHLKSYVYLGWASKLEDAWKVNE